MRRKAKLLVLPRDFKKLRCVGMKYTYFRDFVKKWNNKYITIKLIQRMRVMCSYIIFEDKKYKWPERYINDLKNQRPKYFTENMLKEVEKDIDKLVLEKQRDFGREDV